MITEVAASALSSENKNDEVISVGRGKIGRTVIQ